MSDKKFHSVTSDSIIRNSNYTEGVKQTGMPSTLGPFPYVANYSAKQRAEANSNLTASYSMPDNTKTPKNTNGKFDYKSIHHTNAQNFIVPSVSNTQTDQSVEMPLEYFKDRAKINSDIIDLQKKQKQIDISIRNFQSALSKGEQISDDLKGKLDIASRSVEGISGKIEGFEGRVLEFKEEIEKSRNSFLGIIALFASFFSFISVSINVFSKDMPLSHSVSLIIILWICLMSFIYIFMCSLRWGTVFFLGINITKHFFFVVFCVILALVLPKFILSLL